MEHRSSPALHERLSAHAACSTQNSMSDLVVVWLRGDLKVEKVNRSVQDPQTSVSGETRLALHIPRKGMRCFYSYCYCMLPRL